MRKQMQAISEKAVFEAMVFFITSPMLLDIGFSLKRFRVKIRHMTLPAISPRGMLHANGRHRTRAHMACNTIASHLKIMRNGRAEPRADHDRPKRGGGRLIQLVDNEQFVLLSFGDVALPAGDTFSGWGVMGVCLFSSSVQPPLGMACKTRQFRLCLLPQPCAGYRAATRHIVCGSSIH